MMPWKTRPVKIHRMAWPCFNEATAMMPWKTKKLAGQSTGQVELQ